MNKKMTGLFALILAILFSSSDVDALSLNEDGKYINYYGIEITEHQLENLTNLGFTEEQIEVMEQEEFDNNKNLLGEVVSQETVYYKNTYVYTNPDFITYSSNENENYIVYSEEVTEEEYYNAPIDDVVEITPYGLINGSTTTEYKQLTSTLVAVNNRYRLKADMSWRKMPKVRYKELFTLTMDNWVSLAPNTIQTKQIATRNNPCDKITERLTSNPLTTKQTPDGYAVSFKLPTDSTCQYVMETTLGPVTKTQEKPVNSISSYIYYEINPSTSPIKTLNAYADYAHGTKTISIDPTVTLGLDSQGKIGASITFTGTYGDKFDSMVTAHAALTGINWT